MVDMEQIPVPCRRCGGPMREDGRTALVGPVHVRCPFCQSTEALPGEQAQRVIALRARLAQLRAAQAAEEAPALSYARTIQTLRGQLGFYVGIGALVIGKGLFDAIQQSRAAISLTSLPASAREEILASATFPAISIGVFIGAAIAYVLALSKYKRAIEPTLRARAPMQPGMAARCRACGASLPMVLATSAFLPCAHCAADNLVTAELARDRVRLLDEESRAYSERAAGVHARTTSAAASFQPYFYVGAGVGAVFALGASLLMRLFISYLYF